MGTIPLGEDWSFPLLPQLRRPPPLPVQRLGIRSTERNQEVSDVVHVGSSPTNEEELADIQVSATRPAERALGRRPPALKPGLHGPSALAAK